MEFPNERCIECSYEISPPNGKNRWWLYSLILVVYIQRKLKLCGVAVCEHIFALLLGYNHRFRLPITEIDQMKSPTHIPVLVKEALFFTR